MMKILYYIDDDLFVTISGLKYRLEDGFWVRDSRFDLIDFEDDKKYCTILVKKYPKAEDFITTTSKVFKDVVDENGNLYFKRLLKNAVKVYNETLTEKSSSSLAEDLFMLEFIKNIKHDYPEKMKIVEKHFPAKLRKKFDKK